MRTRGYLPTTLVFLSMLSGTLLIATARPLFAVLRPGEFQRVLRAEQVGAAGRPVEQRAAREDRDHPALMPDRV